MNSFMFNDAPFNTPGGSWVSRTVSPRYCTGAFSTVSPRYVPLAVVRNAVGPRYTTTMLVIASAAPRYQCTQWVPNTVAPRYVAPSWFWQTAAPRYSTTTWSNTVSPRYQANAFNASNTVSPRYCVMVRQPNDPYYPNRAPQGYFRDTGMPYFASLDMSTKVSFDAQPVPVPTPDIQFGFAMERSIYSGSDSSSPPVSTSQFAVTGADITSWSFDNVKIQYMVESTYQFVRTLELNCDAFIFSPDGYQKFICVLKQEDPVRLKKDDGVDHYNGTMSMHVVSQIPT